MRAIVIPAKAGIHGGVAWIPAFAGMTESGFVNFKVNNGCSRRIYCLSSYENYSNRRW